jgi:hypothetical protein
VRLDPSDLQFAQRAVDEAKPVIFTNSAVQGWKALQWTPEYTVKHLKTLRGVYNHTHRIFGPYWDPTRPLANTSGIVRINPHQIIEMDAKEFLHKIRHPSDGNFYYYASNVNHIGSLIEDMYPWSFLELDPESPQQNINFWMGQAHTVADTHYDVYENFNVQVYGRKRWIIFPPNEQLYLYPFLHPSHAQAQE